MTIREMNEQKLRYASGRIASQHHRLESFYSIVSNALARGDEYEAEAGLTSFIDALDAHFTLEECEWFPALASAQSALRQEIAELTIEHEKFLQDLDQVRKRLRMSEFEASFACFDRFLIELARHDDQEERILAGIADIDAPYTDRFATTP